MISVSLLNLAVPWEGLVVCFAVVAVDFDAGAPIFVVSLVAAPRTLGYCFTTSVHCVPLVKTLLAAHWSFISFVNFVFRLFSLDYYEIQWFFFFESK